MVCQQPSVELVYVTPSGVQRHEHVPLDRANRTVIEIIQQSTLPRQYPDGFANIQKGRWGVGIFGVRCRLDKIVQPGDRVECYRPLLLDPKEARRVRAVQKVTFSVSP